MEKTPLPNAKQTNKQNQKSLFYAEQKLSCDVECKFYSDHL